MIIRTNNKDIQVKSVLGEKIKRNGNSYPALRFEFENEITTDDVTALLSGSFEIVDDNNNVIGTYEGYNTKGSISFVMGKITTAEQKVVELEAEKANLETSLATTQAENTELQEAINVMVGGSTE